MMNNSINFYCDESCYLKNDGINVMVLGTVWCESDKKKDIFHQLREIKKNNNLSPYFEAKWTKVSKGRLDFYTDLINYFFNNNDLHFRVLVVPEKSELKHDIYNQTHDAWYYKMYFTLLKAVIDPRSKNRIFLDIKDTRSSSKIRKLHEILCHDKYDFKKEIIELVQTVRSHEVEILQLTDLLIGAVAYENRGLKTNEAKLELIRIIKEKSGYNLKKSTFLRENKFNIFIWHPRSTYVGK